MSFLTFGELYRSVQRLSPNQISIDAAKSTVNEAYRDILQLRSWLGLNLNDTFASLPDKVDGTISLVLGSQAVVGVNTTFAQTDVGRYLEVGSRISIRISAVTDPLSLTLTEPWGEPDLSTTPYIIKTLRYMLPPTASRVIRIVSQNWPLVRQSAGQIDYYDPKRIWRQTAMVFYEIEVTPSGQKEIELWPIPSAAETYSRQCRKVIGDLVNDSDVTVLDGEAIRAKARSMQCELLLSRTGDPNWNALADRYLGQAKELIDAMTREDRRQRGSSPGLLTEEDSPGLAWSRSWSALGLGDFTGTLGGYGQGGWGVATP